MLKSRNFDDVDDTVAEVTDEADSDDEEFSTDDDSIDLNDLESYFDSFDQQYSGDYGFKGQQQRRTALRDVPTERLSQPPLYVGKQTGKRLLTAEEESELAKQIEVGRSRTTGFRRSQ
ncbi:MAG: sigma-70 factor domain-containing protein [Chloroflexota bacterium]